MRLFMSKSATAVCSAPGNTPPFYVEYTSLLHLCPPMLRLPDNKTMYQKESEQTQ